MQKEPGTGRVWWVTGEHTGIYHAIIKYLKSRGQEVVCSSDGSSTSLHKGIDMVIVNDVRENADLPALFRKITDVSLCMRRDGKSRIIFMLSGDHCFQRLSETNAYEELKQQMNIVAIDVRCFESGMLSDEFQKR